MLRYCPSCDKDFDFPVKSNADLENLVCPECGRHIDKNSRRPHDYAADAAREVAIGKTIVGVILFLHILYFVFASLGIPAFYLHWDVCLYILAVAAAGLYMTIGDRSLISSKWGFIAVIMMAGLMAYKYKSIQGACFGICIALVAICIINVLVGMLAGALIKWARKQ